MNRMLSNMQWQWVRFSVSFGLVISWLTLLLISIISQQDMVAIALTPVAGLPFILCLLLAVMVIGAVSGYKAGKQMKKDWISWRKRL